MFWKKGMSLFKTTTSRLTLWHLGIFSLLSVAVFGVVYLSLASHLQAQKDREIIDKAKEFGSLLREHGIAALQSEFDRESESRGTRRVFFRLESADGRVLASSDLRHWPGLARDSLHQSLSPGKKMVFTTTSMAGHPFKIRSVSLLVDKKMILTIGSSLQGDEIILERYREVFGIALIVMLVCGGLVGRLLAVKAMAGVQRITDCAAQIGGYDLSRRVPLGDEGQEITALALAFNAMLVRIETLLSELEQITDNIAHELRTPLTRMRGIAETSLKNDAEIDDLREMGASVIDECDNLVEMITTMLEIAKTDSGTVELDLTPLDISEIVEEAADLFAPLAEDHTVQLKVLQTPEPLMVNGDRPRLQRVIANLLDNALKYTPAGGMVCLSTAREGEFVKVEIADTGTGISEKDLPHIFDRFYRGDKSRSTTGSGLGLSLALALARAHNGDITVTSSDKGATFCLLLPKSSVP
jgi:heavy metal sensor kinase